MKQSMTMRRRMLAVVRGEELDRVPFVQYDNAAAPNREIWGALGREELGLLRWCSAHRFEHPNCRTSTQSLSRGGLRGERSVLSTPLGDLTEVRWFDPVYGSPHIDEHFVKEPEDYRIFLSYLRDITVVEDCSPVFEAIRDFGEDGLPLTAVLRTPFQQLWVQWVSLDDLCLHLADHDGLLHEVTDELASLQRKVFQVVHRAARKVDIPFVDIPDNITAPVIGERLFRTHCLPLYRELADMMAELSIPVWVHMDGDLKPLWKAIGETGIRGIDSLSPPPDNDTPVAEALAMWPDMRLYVNFPSSVHVAEPKTVLQTARRLLDEGGASARMWIQISENVPPGVWRRSFPQIVKAIHDFGRPGG